MHHLSRKLLGLSIATQKSNGIMQQSLKLAIFTATVLGATFLAQGTAHAATITVNTTNASGTG